MILISRQPSCIHKILPLEPRLMRKLRILSIGAVMLVGHRCATYPLKTPSFFLHAVKQTFEWLFSSGQHTIPHFVCLRFPLHIFANFLPSWVTHTTPYDRYPTPRAEQKYWDSALRWRKTLYASDARMHHSPSRSSVSESNIPLPGYFVPRLLPLYRESREVDPESREYELRVKDFRKWRKMVYPEKVRTFGLVRIGGPLLCSMLTLTSNTASPVTSACTQDDKTIQHT